VAGLLAAALAAAPGRAAAQDPPSRLAERPMATRRSLEELVARLEQARSNDRRAAQALATARARLAEGDFRPGNYILLEVLGEPALSDTFRVENDRSVTFPPPTTGSLSLRGVLRAELNDQVGVYLRRFLQAPVTRARPLIHLSIQGQVARAGVYGVPADAVLAEAIMAAGGTTHEADVRRVRIQRDGEDIWRGNLQLLVATGQTLDDANLRDGDQFVVPKRREGGLQNDLRFVWVLVSLAGGVYGLSRIL
jgi:protein involved in polysaccharide export with SLBB domain